MTATVEGINQVIKNNDIDANLVSDGYHTIGELYEHRVQLWIAYCKIITLKNNYFDPHYISHPISKYDVWKTQRHSDGELAFGGGWFVLGITHTFDIPTDDTDAPIDLIAGSVKKKSEQLTYHLDMKYWDQCRFAKTLEQAPEFDGHTSEDVLERLKRL